MTRQKPPAKAFTFEIDGQPVTVRLPIAKVSGAEEALAASEGAPVNASTGHTYTGKNIARVVAACIDRFGILTPQGLAVSTYDGWLAVGRRVKRGHKAYARLLAVDSWESEDKDTGKKRRRSRARDFCVWCLDDTEPVTEVEVLEIMRGRAERKAAKKARAA